MEIVPPKLRAWPNWYLLTIVGTLISLCFFNYSFRQHSIRYICTRLHIVEITSTSDHTKRILGHEDYFMIIRVPELEFHNEHIARIPRVPTASIVCSVVLSSGFYHRSINPQWQWTVCVSTLVGRLT